MSCRSRRLRPAGAVLLLLLASACGDPHSPGGTSAASCVAPYLNDLPPSGPFRGPVPTVGPGAALTVYGHWYTSTCDDTGGHTRRRPLPPVHLILRLPGGAVEELGEFHPHGRDLGFSTAVRVPPGTPAGTATVSDDRPYPATYEFAIGE